MSYHGLRVVPGAVDVAGVTAVLEPLTDHVDPGRSGYAAVLSDRSVRPSQR